MAPRPNVSEERKHQILNAAEEVFSQKGLDDTRMDDIADQTGLSKGTLYLYFKSKDDLIIAIFDRMFQRELNQFDSLLRTDLGAEELLARFTEAMIREVKLMLRLVPLAYEFMAMAFRSKFIQEAFKRYLNRFAEVLVPMIQRGIDAGEFRPVDPLETALTLGAIVEGTILLWVYDRSLVDPERQIRAAMALLMAGLRV